MLYWVGALKLKMTLNKIEHLQVGPTELHPQWMPILRILHRCAMPKCLGTGYIREFFLLHYTTALGDSVGCAAFY